MKIYFKGIFTVNEHCLILHGLKQRPEGTYLITRSEYTGVPKIKRLAN